MCVISGVKLPQRAFRACGNRPSSYRQAAVNTIQLFGACQSRRGICPYRIYPCLCPAFSFRPSRAAPPRYSFSGQGPWRSPFRGWRSSSRSQTCGSIRPCSQGCGFAGHIELLSEGPFKGKRGVVHAELEVKVVIRKVALKAGVIIELAPRSVECLFHSHFLPYSIADDAAFGRLGLAVFNGKLRLGGLRAERQ